MAEGEIQPLTTVCAITETRNLRTPAFIAPEEPCATGNAWENWLEGIEREFRYFKITDPTDKKDALIIYGRKEVAKLEKSRPDPEEGNPYEKLRAKLNDHYLPKKNKHYSRYQFLKLRPIRGESTSSYAARLREKAIDCEFGNTHDDRILEHIIQTIDNKTLIQKSINKAFNLTQLLVEAAQMENIKRQVTAITSPEAEVTARVDRDTQSTQAEIKEINRLQAPEQRRYQGRFCPNPPNQEQETRQRTSPSPRQCQYCGYNHRRGDNCPAFGKRCRKCNKENHFSSVCRSTSNTRGDTQKRDNGSNNQRKNIKRTTEEDSPISSDEYFVQDMLIAYRDTPHPATGVTPYEALYGRPIRTRLDHEARGETDQTDEDKHIDQRDKEYKKRMSQQRRNVKKHQFTLKDYVLLKQKKSNKWTMPFEPAFYVVTNIQGSSIAIKRIKDGRELCRDASQLKLANSLVETDHDLMLPAVERGEKLQSDQETDDEIEDGEVEERERPPDIDQEVENELNNRERRERNLPVRLRDYVLS